MTRIRVWLSHDGYRDPDDNLSMLLGAAYARGASRADEDVQVRGVVFGDTKDGGQYYTLNPKGEAPESFGGDDRYDETAGNKQAAGNYAFFREYGKAALHDLAPGWKIFDTLADDEGGRRPWDFSGQGRISAAARAVAGDIADAVAYGKAGDGTPVKLVVYSAGGGANVAAEAIAYLLARGYAMGDLVDHFAVVQHGNNWVTNYEPEARALTRAFTIAISNQNYAQYENGAAGPDLKHAIGGGDVDGSHYGNAFDTALKVAVGDRAFQGLGDNAIFNATRDASDAGSHAFAVDKAALLAALGDRLKAGDDLHTGRDWAHLIDTDGGTRLREIYKGLSADDIRALLKGTLFDKDNGGGQDGGNHGGNQDGGQDGGQDDGVDGGNGNGNGSGRTVVSLAGGGADRESEGGLSSGDLDLGINRTGSSEQPNEVSLHYDVDAPGRDAEIRSAHLLFTAKWKGETGGSLVIDLKGGDGTSAVHWNDLGAWTPGETYRSPDLAALIARALETGEDFTFEITGGGRHVAHSMESDGLGPQLVIDWDLA